MLLAAAVLFLLDREELDREEHPDEQHRRHRQEGAATASGEVRIPPRQQKRRREREEDEDRSHAAVEAVRLAEERLDRIERAIAEFLPGWPLALLCQIPG